MSVNAKAVKLQRIELVDIDSYVNKVFETVGNATSSIAGQTAQKQQKIFIDQNGSTSSESSFSELRASTIHEYKDTDERDEESNIFEKPDPEASVGPQIVSSLKNNNLPSPQHYQKLIENLDKQYGGLNRYNSGAISKFETIVTEEPMIICQNMDISSIERLNTYENEPKHETKQENRCAVCHAN